MVSIFLSYSRSDLPFVEQLIPLLREVFPEHTIWFDQQIVGGEDWWGRILDEIQGCDLFMALISNDSLSSEFCQKEFREAFHLQKLWLPVLIGSQEVVAQAPDDLKAEIQRLNWVDMSHGFQDTRANAALFRAIRTQIDQIPSQLAGQSPTKRFEIGEFIEAGGMGAVYRGLDRETGQTVAIKQLRPDVISPETLERFDREGEILRRLNHPNIVKLLASFADVGKHYLVMEYVSGGSLRHILSQEKQLSIQRTLAISLELADALARTHHLKVIHRDLKPENVLLSEDGVPHLTDFGIARLESATTLTSDGVIVGTIAYLSPEALISESLDPRSDLWAFGVMLFEMLTGTRPFNADTILGLANAVLHEPTPDVEALNLDIPVALVDLIYRLLEKDRQARLPSARLLAAELQAIIERMDIAAFPDYEAKAEQLARSLAAILPTPQTAKSNLPTQSTQYVGREAELAEIANLLRNPAIRQVTILGQGGMGKTRLALEAANAQLTSFADGVYFVALAALTDPHQIALAVAEAIGFKIDATEERDANSQITAYLRDKQILLVLDNFEHLLQGASLVDAMLDAVPGLKILVTSRQRLNTGNETVFRLGGMDFPDWKTSDEAAEYSAVKLFLQSARRSQPGFALSELNLPTIARICRAVGGLPLGIVLAAVWIDTLSLAEIADEIERSIDILETERSDIPARQRSVRAVFEHSWNLLSTEEQEVFKTLSVFRGGFTREAAQAVTGASLRTLQSLVNKSILRRDPEGRFDLHDLLHRYAAEQLADSPQKQQVVQEQHCAYYVSFLKQRVAWLQFSPEIQPEIPNIKAMLEYAVNQKNNDVFDKLNPVLWWSFGRLNLRADGITFLTHLLETISQEDELLWAQLALQLGGLYDSAYAYKQAGSIFSRCLPIFRRHSYVRGLAEVLSYSYTYESDATKRQQLIEESVPLYRQLGNDRSLYGAFYILVQEYLDQADLKHVESTLQEMEALGLANTGKPDWLYWKESWYYWSSEFERLRGNFAAAKQHRQAAKVLEIAPTSRFGKLTEQGESMKTQGNYEQAEQAFREALTIAQKTRSQSLISDTLRALAFVSWRQGRVADAKQYALASLDATQDVEDALHGVRSNSFNTLAHFTVFLNQDAEAAGYFQQALDTALRQKNLQDDVLQSVMGFATLLGKHSMEAYKVHAVELLSFVRSNPHNFGVLYETDPTGLYEVGVPHWERLQTELPADVFATAVERGKTLDYDAVVAEFAHRE